MKFFPKLPLRKPSLPLSADMPIREIDVRATWSGDVNTPLDVEILYQFNAPSQMLENIFQHNHSSVVDFSIEYIDGYINESIKKNSNIQNVIDSALGTSTFPSPRIAPSPTPSSIADLPWTQARGMRDTDSAYERNVSSIYAPGFSSLLGLSPAGLSPVGFGIDLGHIFEDDDDSIPPFQLSPLPSLPSCFASSPICSPLGSPLVAPMPARQPKRLFSSTPSTNPNTTKPSSPLSSGFSEASSSIYSDLSASPTHIFIHNASPSFKHIRILLRASILLIPALSGRGYTFSVPGLANFIDDRQASGLFTLTFTTKDGGTGWQDWMWLDSNFDVRGFADWSSSCDFSAREGYSLRLLKPSDVPVIDEEGSSLLMDLHDSLSPAAAAITISNPVNKSSQCPFLHAWSTFIYFLASLFTLPVLFFASLFTTLRPRQSWLSPFLTTLKFTVLLWLLLRAFLHAPTLAIESRALGVLSSSSPFSLLWASPVSEVEVPTRTFTCDRTPPPPVVLASAVVVPPPASVPSGPESIRDRIDYFLGWRGPNDDWL